MSPEPTPEPGSNGYRPAPGVSRLSVLAQSDAARAAGMGVAAMVTNVIALVFTVVFARLLGEDGYGSLAALLSAFVILGIPATALQVHVAREVAAELTLGRSAAAGSVRHWIRRLLVLVAAAAAVGLLLREPLAAVVGVDEEWAAGAALPTAGLYLVLCVQRGALQGFGRYKLVAASLIGEASGRLLFALPLVLAGLDVTGAFLGGGLGVLATSVVLGAALHRELVTHAATAVASLGSLVARAWAPVLALALFGALQNVDVIVVNHRFPDDDASSYAAAAVAAKVIIWTAIGLGMFLLPEAARRTRLGDDARPILIRTLGLVGAAAVPMLLVYAVAGELLLEVVFGADLATAHGALPWLGAAMTLLALTYLSMQHLLALHRAAFIWLLAAAAAVQPLAVVSSGDDLTRVGMALAALQLALVLGMAAISFLRSQPPGRAPAETMPGDVPLLEPQASAPPSFPR